MSYSKLINLEEIKNKKVLFYDLETTGLVNTQRNTAPEECYPDYKDLTKYNTARIVSIGWLYIKEFNYDCEIKIDNISECIIKPNGFIIPNESIKIHGITNECAINNGIRLKKILKKIGKIIKSCDYIIGYNVYYDINILLSELHRKKRNLTINKILKLKEEKNIICIGQIASMNAKPSGWLKRFNYQMPSQVNVYRQLFNEELENAHNAKSDVLGMIKIIFWIYKNVLIKQNFF